VRTRWPAVRFVLASGCVQLDPAEARARGAHTVLCKPYDVDDLRAALSAAA
jgi:ActR/RegA family two-component response regulator